jgi:hypothetical protein
MDVVVGDWFADYKACFKSGPRSSGQFQRLQHDPLADQILTGLLNGEQPPTGSQNREIQNTLTRLRRRGDIKNVGSRSHPRWVIVSS